MDMKTHGVSKKKIKNGGLHHGMKDPYFLESAVKAKDSPDRNHQQSYMSTVNKTNSLGQSTASASLQNQEPTLR